MMSSPPLVGTLTESTQLTFAPFAQRMRAAGLPEIVITTFRYYYEQLVAGETGLIPEDTIRPVKQVPDADTFAPTLAEQGAAALPHTVMIKLNGGLGTTMGLQGPKSLLVVKKGLSFLDIIAHQARLANIRLVLMNSFSTREASLQKLRAFPELWADIPLDFLQHKVPKIDQATLAPARWPRNPQLEWNPPGHGEIYTALMTSGMLDQLLEHEIHYAFVSNVDNLGAVIDLRILGYFVENRLPFMMEVADRTAIDRKGGHLAQKPDGQLILRESAQCPEQDRDAFQDIHRHRYFNTNNIWLDLRALKQKLSETKGILGLPMIRNRKTIDPRDPSSPPVYQLESAMGSAIAIFSGASAIRVPRTRFAPVKNTNDLLTVRSDVYILTEDYRLTPNPKRIQAPPIVDLDTRYYKHVDDLEQRFPAGPPSLLSCQRLVVRGDVRFGRGVVLQGDVLIENNDETPLQLADHILISD